MDLLLLIRKASSGLFATAAGSVSVICLEFSIATISKPLSDGMTGRQRTTTLKLSAGDLSAVVGGSVG